MIAAGPGNPIKHNGIAEPQEIAKGRAEKRRNTASFHYSSNSTMKKTTHYIKSLIYDIPSASVVFLVALPLCLGIALGSNAPLFSGLIAGIAGGIVIGILSGSQRRGNLCAARW